MPLLAVLHVFAGVAAAGVLLTVQTMALETAPEVKATPYLGIAGLGTGLGAGVSPIVGGVLADFFSVRHFRIDLTWATPGNVIELPAVTLTGHDFLFVLSFVIGLLSLNLLAGLQEEGAVGRDVAMRELTAGMGPALRAASTVPGVTAVSAASYGYLRRVPGADVALGSWPTNWQLQPGLPSPPRAVAANSPPTYRLVLQRQFKAGQSEMRAKRTGAWRGSDWPARCYTASALATAADGRAQTAPRGSISRTTRQTCGLVIRGIFFPQACRRLSRKAPPSRHRAT